MNDNFTRALRVLRYFFFGDGDLKSPKKNLEKTFIKFMMKSFAGFQVVKVSGHSTGGQIGL